MQGTDEKGFHMTYLKITFLIFAFTSHAMADSSTPKDDTKLPHEENSVSDFFTGASDFLAELMDEWFGEALDSEIELDKDNSKEPVQTANITDEKTLSVIDVQASAPASVAQQPQEPNINEKISELEKRRLAMEMKRLEAEEKRLAAAEKRLAAAERRLAAEQIRLATEEKKLLSADVSSLTNQSSVLPPAQLNNNSKTVAAQQPQNAEKPIASNKPEEKAQKKLKSVVSTTKNPAFIKLENQYYLDLYKWELKTEVYRLVKYPDWAKSLKKTGNVTLDFTVNRNAEVSKVRGDNTNVSIQLVSELHRAIIAAAKRVLPPDALPGDSWNMNMSYNFQLEDVEQVALVKPTKPLFLEREHSIVVIDNDNNLENYQKDVRDLITEGIEYPVWAKNLKQRGTVSFEIVINQDGTISDITPKGKNRHVFLNQEVLRAINDSAPLPSIPEHLRLQSTSMVIEHEFRR